MEAGVGGSSFIPQETTRSAKRETDQMKSDDKEELQKSGQREQPPPLFR